jgi:hypothetical protein
MSGCERIGFVELWRARDADAPHARSKRPVTKGAAAALILTLAGCDEGYSNAGGAEGRTLPDIKEAVTVRTSPGDQARAAFLVAAQRDFNPSELAAAVRNVGYACERVRRFNELEQNGKRTSIYKIDCLEYSYQFMRVGGKSHIKRWSGILTNE